MLFVIDKDAVSEALMASMKGTGELAEETNLSSKTIRRIASRTGAKSIRPSTLKKLSTALDVDPRTLVIEE